MATEAMLLYSNRSQIQEEEEGEQARGDLVFSAEEDLDEEELSRCRKVLKSREPPLIHATMPPGEGRRTLYERFIRFRLNDLKLMENSLNSNGTANTVVVSEYSDEFWSFENPHLPVPGRGTLGWTIDRKCFYLDGLDDYQRIVLTRADIFEYPKWEKYHLMFSKRETDEEYVQYWDELFKRIKWIGDYLDLEFGDEYICALKHDNAYGKGYVRAHLELWKRVTKHNMIFEEALRHILKLDYKFPSGCSDTVNCEDHFSICMNHIKKHIVHGDDDDDDTVLKHINDALHPEIERQKMYVDYAQKKLLVARRIGTYRKPQAMVEG